MVFMVSDYNDIYVVKIRIRYLQKEAWREWVAAGRPRDATSALWVKYKECKKLLDADSVRSSITTN